MEKGEYRDWTIPPYTDRGATIWGLGRPTTIDLVNVSEYSHTCSTWNINATQPPPPASGSWHPAQHHSSPRTHASQPPHDQ